VAREGFLKDKCGPRAKKFEHHWHKVRNFAWHRLRNTERSVSNEVDTLLGLSQSLSSTSRYDFSRIRFGGVPQRTRFQRLFTVTFFARPTRCTDRKSWRRSNARHVARSALTSIPEQRTVEVLSHTRSWAQLGGGRAPPLFLRAGIQYVIPPHFSLQVS